ncbi:hypothetical protein BrE312_1660 [Brenneria sp. EniD312]|nr:hypothetical protein BrE312_1660 [Brenneria sp. EniD312]
MDIKKRSIRLRFAIDNPGRPPPCHCLLVTFTVNGICKLSAISCAKRKGFLCHVLARARLRALKRRSPENPGYRLKLCRCAVPSAPMTAIRATSDGILVSSLRLALPGQRKRCSKTLPTFLSDAALVFAASLLLTRRSSSPQHNFLRRVTAKPVMNPCICV